VAGGADSIIVGAIEIVSAGIVASSMCEDEMGEYLELLVGMDEVVSLSAKGGMEVDAVLVVVGTWLIVDVIDVVVEVDVALGLEIEGEAEAEVAHE